MKQFSLLSIASTVVVLSSEGLAMPAESTVSTYGTTPKIVWSSCTGADPANLRCGSVLVPVDYSNPTGAQFNVTFARISAKNTTSRIGSLVVNPGGPGGAASDLVFGQIAGAPIFSDALLAQYDIIGLDPRGTGLSSPMKCDPTIWNKRVSLTPKNAQEYDQLVAHNKAFSASCKAKSGTVFDFLGTASAAKDMEIVRQALGEGKLNYLGLSYGSNLGSTYAGLYPENVGRMVLDGIMDTSDSDTSQLMAESTSYEATLKQFFDWCSTSKNCALNGQDAAKIFDTLITSANTSPIPAPGCTATTCRSDATGEEILTQVQLGLLFVDPSIISNGWPALSVAIAEASKGNATLLSMPIKTAQSDSDFSYLGIICKDLAPTAKSQIDLAFKRQLTGVFAPHTKGNGQFYQAQAACIGWASPPTPVQKLLPAQVAKLPKILLANSLYDPSTSLEWANSLRIQIPNSVLAIRNGSGHTSYLNHGKIAGTMDNFLLTGTLPAQGAMYDS